jgi:mono/diheme cytochrome c family protein
MKAIKQQFQFFFLFILCLSASEVTLAQKETAEAHKARWHEPAGIEAVQNPFVNAPGSADSGKVIYMKICSVCHGNSGKGDGVAAGGLAVRPADHTSAAVQAAPDGQLFWELTNGHAPMPSYKTALTDKQRWEVVCFIRTLKPKSHK